MDLYEALKSGVTIEELRASFEDEVNTAKDRLAKEQEKAKKRELDAARIKAATAYAQYFNMTCDEGYETTVKEVEAALKNMEQVTRIFNKGFKSIYPAKTSTEDEAIIRRFLDNL